MKHKKQKMKVYDTYEESQHEQDEDTVSAAS